MRSYKVIVSKKALSDLDSIAAYVAGFYRPSSGHKYVNRILGQIASLAFTADIYRFNGLATAKAIHPQANLPH